MAPHRIGKPEVKGEQGLDLTLPGQARSPARLAIDPRIDESALTPRQGKVDA
jgi:hypothetical protein